MLKTCESNANENVESVPKRVPKRHNRALGPKIGPKWPYSKGMAKGHAFLMHEQAHAQCSGQGLIFQITGQDLIIPFWDPEKACKPNISQRLICWFVVALCKAMPCPCSWPLAMLFFRPCPDMSPENGLISGQGLKMGSARL